MNLSAAKKIVSGVGESGKETTKKAFDMFKVNIGGDVDVVVTKNPSHDDLYAMSQKFRREHPNAKGEPYVRHTFDANGNEYVWDSYDAMHSQIEPKIDTMFNTLTHQNGPNYFDVKYPELFKKTNKNTAIKYGAGAIGAGSALAGNNAYASQWNNFKSDEEELQDAYNPLDAAIAFATGGATLTLKAAAAALDPIIDTVSRQIFGE